MTVLAISSVQAQEVSDAMRYAQDNLTGTARFRAMSGAFGALGGDFSSLSVNPAGGAVFLTSQIAVTVSNQSIKNKSNYFGTSTSENENSFDLNQLGAVWVFNNNEDSVWNKFTVGANYESTRNFDNQIYSQGNNPVTSISNYFLSYANGNNFGDYNQLQTDLGYQGYLINEGTGGSNIYTSNTPAGGNYYQENTISTSGYNSKLSFNIATQLKDRFYFGLNLNSHFTDYTQLTSFYEDYLDTPGSSNATGIQASRFNNELYSYGNGFSFQLGAIAKVTNNFRAGVAYESPTWYRFTEDMRQTLAVDCADCATNPGFNDSGITTYPDYRLKTAGKFTGSLAYVFGKIGLLSVDYAIKDYSNTRFRPNDSFFSSRNNQMESLLDVTSEVRIGAETRYKNWSFRGGYRFEQSPYKDGKTIGDLNSVSGGFGYNFGPVKADIAYAYAKRDSQQQFFSQGLIDRANINSVSHTVGLTLLFEM